jgi:DNA-directed RNA polymerase specialized sigma24 family protein
VAASLALQVKENGAGSAFCNETASRRTIPAEVEESNLEFEVRPLTHNSPLQARKSVSEMTEPGAFQCMLLRAFELPKTYREVFLLKEIQGHTLAEIAAILGITIDTALVRLKRARHEIGHSGDSDAREHGE